MGLRGIMASRLGGAAGIAGAQLLRAVERLEERRQIVDNVADMHLHPVQQRMALGAEPLETVVQAGRRRSTTSPTLPGSGRCGEWRTCGGSNMMSP
jgi:hypothetical protein